MDHEASVAVMGGFTFSSKAQLGEKSSQCRVVPLLIYFLEHFECVTDCQ